MFHCIHMTKIVFVHKIGYNGTKKFSRKDNVNNSYYDLDDIYNTFVI